MVAVLHALSTLTPAATPSLVVDGEPVSVHETMQHDAVLTDVAFVDRQTGWAVGDRGVIWHTTDGGQSWQLQESGVTGRLESVCFVDARRGCAVGGTHPPYGASSRCVLLATVDGGENWQQFLQPTLPALRRVKMFDADRGVVIGESTPAHASGVYATHDGGATWQTVPTDSRAEWLTGDFVDPDTGAVAGAAGQFATLERRRIELAPAVMSSLRSYHALRLLPPPRPGTRQDRVPGAHGWLVGDGGIVMTTRDLGRSWQTPPGELPLHVAENFDFHALATGGQRVWVAGSPGTRVFHSPDGGRSWQSHATGQRAPIRAMWFVDDHTGWAVGDLGTILATRDGGRTWQVQRQGGARAALLAVFARDADVPLELLAKYGAEEGYLTSVSLLDADAGAATGEALSLAGATASDSAWRFPLPAADLAMKPADLIELLNRENDGRGIERLRSQFVRQLRLWRPSVVVTHHDEMLYSDPHSSLIQQSLVQAVEAAGDPTQYPELAAEVGLTAWQVERVYGVLPPGSRGSPWLATGQYAPRLGATLADWTAPARGLIHASHPTPPDMIEMQLLSDATRSKGADRDLFYGMQLAPGGEARRRLANLAGDDPNAQRQMALRQRQMQVLVERSANSAAWTAQVEDLIAGLDDQQSGELLFHLADNFRDRGRLDLAADALSFMVRRWPDHPLADPALTWLVQFYASSETALHSATERATNVRTSAVELPDTTNAGIEGVQPASAVSVSGAAGVPAIGLARDDRLRRAATLGNYLEQVRPQLYLEPAVRFPLVVAERQLGYANPAKRYFLSLRSLPASDPWHRCAETEEWLAQPEGLPPPKALGHCRPAATRPRLDGQLDEWEKRGRESFLAMGQSREVTRSEKDSRPLFFFTYDREFLYVAVCCPKVPDETYEPDDRPRPRDADLNARDRVTFELDVDRDYTTAFELTVDYRGWTHDACWGNAHWDPTWYVAAASDDDSWTVEAAIPLAELVAEPPVAREVWAVAVRRTIPGVGYESWAGDPGDDSSPDRFGLVIFE